LSCTTPDDGEYEDLPDPSNSHFEGLLRPENPAYVRISLITLPPVSVSFLSLPPCSNRKPVLIQAHQAQDGGVFRSCD